MHGVFDEGEHEPDRNRHDTELTLSSITLLAIFFGLVLLCGLFFGLGFTVGRYGRSDTATASQQPTVAPETSLQADGSRPKPSASAQPTSVPQRTVVNLPPSTSSETNPAANHQSAGVGGANNSTGQPVVKPALPPTANTTQPAPRFPTPAFKTEPSTAAAAPLMVQIAAVYHQEDADVLVGALRKRGYKVSVRRQPSDSMIHVQIGPFNSRNDAYAMRQKLLNDGYNAIVEP